MKAFAKNHHTGGKKGSPKPSDVLAEMRYVSKNKAQKNEAPLRQKCRGILEDNPEKFIVLLGKLERDMKTASKEARAGMAPGESSGEDVGEDTIRELIQRILQEAKGKDVA